jgi:dTDP-4-amino-4,6-dideoxygalactose transaminase
MSYDPGLRVRSVTIIQLRKLSTWHWRRHAMGTRIDTAPRELPAPRVPMVPDHLRHAYYRAYAYVRPDALRAEWSRQRTADEVRAAGVPCFLCHPTFPDGHVGRAVEVVGRATQ